MNTTSPAPVGETSAASLEALQTHFLSIMPRIRTHAEVCFRHLRCAARRADAVAEVIALCWKWYLRIVEQGKDVNEFVTTLADFAVRHVRCGRRLCGQERAKDVFSVRAQHRQGFKVESLPSSTRQHLESLYSDPHGQQAIDAFEERLRDNTITPPDEQAAFRIDFPLWLAQLGERKRAIAEDMTLDISTTELAGRYKVSPGRISQYRREFHTDWQRFHGEVV
jgi:hypothetical protein